MKLLRSSLAAISVLTAAVLLRSEPVPPTPAPAWTLLDVNGTAVNSDQFKGKVVVIDFWATWCGPCRAEIPGYIRLQDKYRDKGLVIIGVSVDQQGPGVVKKFIAQQRMTYQVVMGTDEVVEAFGGFDAIPTTFIIDRSGKIRERKTGTVETDEYEKTLLKYLNEK